MPLLTWGAGLGKHAAPPVKGPGDESALFITSRRAAQDVSPALGELTVYALLFISQYLYPVLFSALRRFAEYVKLTQIHR